MGIKIVSVFAGNVSRGLPTITALMVLNNVETGEPLVAMEAAYLTALRTGAAAGVAAKYLVRRNARTAVIFGAGAQARTQLQGLAAVRGIEKAYVFDINAEAAERFATEMAPETGVTIVPGRAGGSPADNERIAAAIADADAIIAATTSKTPVFDGRLIKPGTHVTGIGSYAPDMQELDENLVMRADLFFCDTKEGAWAEAGDLLKPLSKGVIGRDRVDGELGDLVLGRRTGRTNDQQVTIYKGVGLAALDLATAKLVYDRAVEQKMGIRIDMLS
jgi:ornithine cyclodeaminase/alanine dehydrogenase-like protein (mu-crystallin family)